MESAIYEGKVRHRRFEPRSHEFTYDLYMMYLDLDELDTVFGGSRFWSNGRRNLAWFNRKDYLRPTDVSLRDAVAALVKQKTGRETPGPIRMLSHCRYAGFCFNPVSFYYCFDEDGRTLLQIVAEINNTPWKERFQYVLVPENGTDLRHVFEFDKEFHVSPFMPMDMKYKWHFNTPCESLFVHMENTRDRKKHFDATLTMQRQEITPRSLNRMLWRYPLMTVKVHAGIYWQALKLFVKKVPFHSHPENLESTDKKELPEKTHVKQGDHSHGE